MEAAQVEERNGDPREEILAEGEFVRKLEAEDHNGKASRGAASRGRGPGTKRGRGRRAVAPLRSGFRGAQNDCRGRPHGSGLRGSLAHEADFCLSEGNAWNGTRVPTSISYATRKCACGPVAALHGLLTPQAAAAAFAAGTNLSTEWGDLAVKAKDTEIVHAAYEETPEGHFLRTAMQLPLDATNRVEAKQYAFDVQSLRRDLIFFPTPVRFWRSRGSKSARHQQLRTGACVVPPLESAAPHWFNCGERDTKEQESAYGAAQEDSGRVVEESPMHEGNGRESMSESDALLNVGGSILAVAVSQECGVAEALNHCRERQAATGGDDAVASSEGFVVIAVSVGPVQRVTAHAPHLTSHAPASGDPSRSPTSDLFEANNGGTKGGTLPAPCGEKEGQPPRQQQRKASGQVQLWTISSNPSVKPRLRVILQDDGGIFRSLHWIHDSQLLLPRHTIELCADATPEGEKSKDCGCCKGIDCHRSRLGLLCGVNDSGALIMWSVPLAPFLPDDDDLLGDHRGLEPGSPLTACEVERRSSKARDPVAQGVEAHMHNIRCCALPPVWKFKSPNVRLFCCAAAPGHGAGAFARELCWQEPVILVGGAGEGRLYVFSFSAETPSSQFCSSHAAGSSSSSGLTLPSCGSIGERPRCSMYVLTPGCHSSEGEAAALEQGGQGGAVCWQWSLADADDQRELSRMIEKQPELVQAQRVAEHDFTALRRTLLDLLKEQMAGLASSESTQQTQPQHGLSVDLMQQRVDTLLALQQLEERCELLQRGLVIAEGGGLAAVAQKSGKRSGQMHVKTRSILALRK
ncbi:hypothetical protein ACSSS7_001916 [Eimeria intestinalis]